MYLMLLNFVFRALEMWVCILCDTCTGMEHAAYALGNRMVLSLMLMGLTPKSYKTIGRYVGSHGNICASLFHNNLV